MKKYATAYAMFVAFTLVTVLIVRPLAQKSNIPLLNKI